MITEIKIENVASYKKATKFSPKNKISLLYGLNGTGKSTISNYLYDPQLSIYRDCNLSKSTECDVLVYNQKFLNDYFYEEDSLKGIFTLSKENKSILQEIQKETTRLDKLESDKKSIDEKLANVEKQLSKEKEKAIASVWKIKTSYSGGDRVLEYCLEGLKIKERLFSHINNIGLPEVKPEDTIEKIKNEISLIEGENANRLNRLGELTFTGLDIEKNKLFSKIIVGSQEGSVAEFINNIGNIDWVKDGLSFVSTAVSGTASECPFCQEKTITQELLSSIKSVFDISYENDIEALKKLQESYKSAAGELAFGDINELIVITPEISKQWELSVEEIKSIYRENILLIENKLKSPSTPIVLKSCSSIFFQLNDVANQVNVLIDEHNNKLDNKASSLSEIKRRFWNLMRWEFDQTLSIYNKDKIEIEKLELEIKSNQASSTREVTATKQSISSLRKKTVNVEEAVENINNALIDIGIVGFTVINHGENLYKIARTGKGEDVFHSLSEGEKTVISFLYFIELCKGEKTAGSSPNKKIVVIDDPISSLSHIYVFNIGKLIKKTFFNSSKYEQVIVFTHSLYFFYELTHTNKVKRDMTQNLYRVVKNSDGSSILNMKYEEIQNDYQTYWTMIKDSSTPPALLANCMRNIVEYFFSFVQKKDFNNVFQMPALSADKFEVFYRYMNRESHSLGQNIFDIKEFDYDTFKEGLKLIFDECGYIEHYKAMMK